MATLPNTAFFSCIPILEMAFDGIALVTPDSWSILYVNPTLAHWLGRTASELHGLRWEEVFGRDGLDRHKDRIECGDAGQDNARLSVELPIQVGRRSVVARARRIDIGGQQFVAIVLCDPGAAREAVEADRLRFDPLTGLADREFLLSRLAALMRGERCGDRDFAVLFVDLDNFKQVNDAHGHLIGDRVLREVARRLSSCVREGDHVVRFGGDEFVVLVENLALESEAQPIINRIHSVLAKPIALPEGAVTLTASIGAAQASVDHNVPEDLIAEADRAMYSSKRGSQ